MEIDDVIARVREQRFQGLIRELLPRLRRLNAMMDDEPMLVLTESMAELKLPDEDRPPMSLT